MKLKEAFARKAYRDRNLVQGRNCTGQPSTSTYIIAVDMNKNNQLGDNFDTFEQHVESWVPTVWPKNTSNSPEYVEPKFFWWDGNLEIEVTVPSTIELKQLVQHIDDMIDEFSQ